LRVFVKLTPRFKTFRAVPRPLLLARRPKRDRGDGSLPLAYARRMLDDQLQRRANAGYHLRGAADTVPADETLEHRNRDRRAARWWRRERLPMPLCLLRKLCETSCYKLNDYARE